MSELQDEVSALGAKLEHLELDNKKLTDNLRDAHTEIRSLRSLVPDAMMSQFSQRCRTMSVCKEDTGNVVLLKLDLSQIEPQRQQSDMDSNLVVAPSWRMTEHA